ncbi:mitochondrial assembly of ribosomal large subunit protein 1 [Ornithorhynchus anatinus]|uniref:Mitochondrial assembly of ribosomal large subunit protein 1 n=1 Tax=Ornithorhynchus anatinus TaxID=9258 RepID=A0A6I8PDF0_ORNAN|nr:mitochondrial assembly of ribosomal large subunit protein 1 [Ornithorhynchus anatinus]
MAPCARLLRPPCSAGLLRLFGLPRPALGVRPPPRCRAAVSGRGGRPEGPRPPWLLSWSRCAISARGLHDDGRSVPPQPNPHRDPAGHTDPKFDIDMVVSLLRQENAKDICVIQVPPEMKYTDYFLVVSGSSTRHLHAMANYLVKVYKQLKCPSEPHVLIEGKSTEDWLCIDFGKMVVHLMLPQTREFYELEKLWTLRSYDDQLALIAPESLPEDFILDFAEDDSEYTVTGVDSK